MNKTIAACAITIGLWMWAGALFAGDEKKKQDPKQDKAQQEMMEAWMKYAEPGEHHEHLKVLAGNWKTTSKWWVAPGEPQVGQGMSKNEWILGGRFLKSTYKDLSEEHPFEGFGLLGYDTYKKQHVSVWCDTMSTMVGVSYGTCDDSGKVFTYTATYDDPMTGQPKKMKMVTKVINENKHVFTIHNIDKDGTERLELEVIYTRIN